MSGCFKSGDDIDALTTDDGDRLLLNSSLGVVGERGLDVSCAVGLGDDPSYHKVLQYIGHGTSYNVVIHLYGCYKVVTTL